MVHEDKRMGRDLEILSMFIWFNLERNRETEEESQEEEVLFTTQVLLHLTEGMHQVSIVSLRQMYQAIQIGIMVPDTESHLIDTDRRHRSVIGHMVLATDHHIQCMSVGIVKDLLQVLLLVVHLMVSHTPILHGVHPYTKDIHSLHLVTILLRIDSLHLDHSFRLMQ